MSPKQLWRLLKETFTEWTNDKSSRLAAALAYYTVFSMAPLLILVVAIAGFFFDQAAAREAILTQVRELVGQNGAEFVQSALENSNRPGQNSGAIATVISIALLLVGATGVFTQLQESLNQIWNVEAKPDEGLWGMIRKRVLSFGMIVVIGFILLVSLAVSAAVAGFSSYLNGLIPGLDTLVRIINFVLSFGLTTLLFALIYRFLPDVQISWKDVWFGSAITALLFTIGKWLIGIYLANSGFSSTYGAAGSVVIVLAWVFYSAQILFFGAEFTEVYARRFGSQIVPDRHAVRIDPSKKL